MATILIRNAMILTLDRDERIIGDGHVVIEGGAICAVGAGRYDGELKPTKIIEGRDRLVAPGLVNAHTHSQSSTMTGFADRVSHPAFMWLTQAHTSNRTADEIRLAVQLAAYGMLTTGTTAALDHFPGQRFSADDLDAVLAAWDETGMRAALAMRFFDGPFSDILPSAPLPDEVRRKMSDVEVLKPQPLAELVPLMTGAIERWHRCGSRITVMPAPSNPDRCTDEAIVLCAELAVRYDTGIHTHLLETRKQAELSAAKYGTTCVQHLDDLGVLSDRWSCAHCVWLTDTDMALMAERGAIAVLNPESNARIGTGRARVPDMRRAGMRMAIGTDGSGANDNQVMHEAMRAVATEHRADDPDRQNWISARDALRMATAGGAAALRDNAIGRIETGATADLVIYNLDMPWWLPVNDPVDQLVFAETGAGVETVIVDGRVVVEEGRVLSFDVDAMKREVREMVRSLRKRNESLFEVAGAIAEIVP